MISKCLRLSLYTVGSAIVLAAAVYIIFLRKSPKAWIMMLLLIASSVVIAWVLCKKGQAECTPCTCPDCPKCPNCCDLCTECKDCPWVLQKPVLAAYYTFYQDPNCSSPDCDPKPCTETILSDPRVLNSKLDLVIVNPIAPATAGGVTLSYINSVYTGQSSQSDTYYPPPPSIKKGIDDLHTNHKKIILSFMPGSAKDRWGQGKTWFSDFQEACQKIMTEWDIDGFDWDCETDGCPPNICGGGWTDQNCIDNAVDLFTSLKNLKPNKGRGLGDGTPIVTWTGELTWQLAPLVSMKPFANLVDFFLTMNENYSVVDPSALYTNMKNFSSQKGYPMNRIINGVKSGGCWPGTNGDGTNVDTFKTLMTAKVDGDKTLSDIGAGWSIWNLCRDFGCTYGRSSTPANSSQYGASKTCMACNTGACPIGDGSQSGGTPFAFLHQGETVKE